MADANYVVTLVSTKQIVTAAVSSGATVGMQNGSPVAVSMSANRGPKGDPNSYTFSQSVPSAYWVIPHDLNRIASVTIVDSSGAQAFGEVQIGLNTTIVSFSAAFSGTAYVV